MTLIRSNAIKNDNRKKSNTNCNSNLVATQIVIDDYQSYTNINNANRVNNKKCADQINNTHHYNEETRQLDIRDDIYLRILEIRYRREMHFLAHLMRALPGIQKKVKLVSSIKIRVDRFQR